MNQNCASKENETKDGRQNEPDANRDIGMFASKLLWRNGGNTEGGASSNEIELIMRLQRWSVMTSEEIM